MTIFCHQIYLHVRSIISHPPPIRVRNTFEFYFMRVRVGLRICFQFFLSPLEVFVKQIGYLLTDDHEAEPHDVNLQVEHRKHGNGWTWAEAADPPA